MKKKTIICQCLNGCIDTTELDEYIKNGWKVVSRSFNHSKMAAVCEVQKDDGCDRKNICPNCNTEMTDVMFGKELWWMCPNCGVLEEYERGNESEDR